MASGRFRAPTTTIAQRFNAGETIGYESSPTRDERTERSFRPLGLTYLKTSDPGVKTLGDYRYRLLATGQASLTGGLVGQFEQNRFHSIGDSTVC
jgi:hypothetical protein